MCVSVCVYYVQFRYDSIRKINISKSVAYVVCYATIASYMYVWFVSRCSVVYAVYVCVFAYLVCGILHLLWQNHTQLD